jgi:ABC-type nitrate/sulfonate/bicarbonate transport system ATPase subunit
MDSTNFCQSDRGADPETRNDVKLCAEGVCKTFGAGPRHGALAALQGVQLSVREGEFVSIIGPSGCGKSTLFNVLAGLSPPSSGTILLDGCPVDSLLGRVGYMPQKDLLMPWRTVLDNATLGLEFCGVSRSRARSRAIAELPRFGLAGFERRWPASLSGGMRQRAAVLRTFLAGRDVMLFDEPFGALDALTRQTMQEWLLEIWHTDRKTILFVTHDVEEAIYLSDRVYVMSGRPGHMQMCVDVCLSRPREADITATQAFVELKQRLLAPLREASLEQMGI